MKDYENTLKDYQYMFDLSQQYDLYSQYSASIHLARLSRVTQQYEASLKALKEADQYQQQHSFRDYSTATEFALVYEEIGDFEAAFTYTKEAQKGEIEYLEEKIASLETELLVKYDTEQKEATIANQSIQIQQQKRIQQLSFSIGGE